MKEAWIIDAVRTPIGKHGGSLAQVRPDDLGAVALKALLERTKVPASEVEDVYMGCANQAGEDNRNVGRMAAILAGFPLDVPGCTVNRLCGSGLEAVASAARAVMLGEADVYIGAGVESMTRAPWAMPKAEAGYPRGNVTAFDTSLGWRFTNPKLEQMGHTDSLGMTAENLAEMYKISREDQDRFAFRSQKKAAAAIDAGAFKGEIAPVQTKKALFDTDEGPRRDTSLEKLATLSPAFKKGGTVTAGNSSTLNDGAAAVLVASREYAQAHGLVPMAKVRSIGVAGVPPRIMGFGPVPAAQKALKRAGITMGDIGLIELNEAFAAQSLAVFLGWGMDFEDDRVNVNGGAIALGHPLGCSGARILTTLLHEMRRRDSVGFGLATMCIGVGQ
ncbi:MAG TPA: thiolase family protein, partial [Candidatus Deferrimicrobiaceae bacterium]